MSEKPSIQRGVEAGRRPWVRPVAPGQASSAQRQGAGGSVVVAALAMLVVVSSLGRPFDYVLSGLHLPAVISTLAILTSLLAGGLAALRSRVGLPLVGLVLWMGLVTPFSFWKGGSAEYLARFAFVAFSCLLPLAAGPRSPRDLRRVLLVMAIAPTLMLALTGGGGAAAINPDASGMQVPNESGRLTLSGGTFANSGDLGLAAGFVVPFWLFVCSQFQWPMIRIPLALLAVAFAIRAALLTGSRSALVGGAAMFEVYFFATRASRKLLLPVAAGVAILVVPFFLPGQTTARLKSIVDAFYTSDADSTDTEAGQSAAMRRALLMDSLRYTITHPLTGVGPGQFTDVRWQEGVEGGQPKGYLITHNTYTQVSSEEGIPGLLFYLAILFGIFRTLRSVKRLNKPDSHPEWRSVKSMQTCLMAAFCFYAAVAFFLSTVTYAHLFLLAGCALALERVTKAAVDDAAAAGLTSDQEAGPATIASRAGGGTPSPRGYGVRSAR